MFSKMQSSVYQNRGGSQHHAPRVSDVRFGGIDTNISVDQKLVPAPRPTLENAAAREFIPPAMSTVTGTDGANLASWSSVFTYLMEGFALYGASLHPNAYFPVERMVALEPEPDINRIAPNESEVATADDILVEFDGVTSPHIAQPSRRNWLTSPWKVLAALWAVIELPPRQKQPF
jgi:hypothetical protein